MKSPEQGFFIRLKPRDVYFGIALHEGDGDTESEGEPLMTVTDRDGPLGSPALYGFALVTGKGNEVGMKRLPSVVQVTLGPCVEKILVILENLLYFGSFCL